MRSFLSKRNTAGGEKMNKTNQPIANQIQIRESYKTDNALIFSAEHELMRTDSKSIDQDRLNSGVN